MRDFKSETIKRVEFIRKMINSAGAEGIIYGNSGGKDSALTGILCKMSCENTMGLIMPCGSRRNYEIDRLDAEKIAEQYGISTKYIDLNKVRNEMIQAIGESLILKDMATANISPRLRMTALYAVASSENRLVAGTGNLSEGYMGYFTKWGDGAYDFNPIADLTVTEIYEFLRFLDAPDFILHKAPSAGLFDGQTDEEEMGISYKNIDRLLLSGMTDIQSRAIIEKFHKSSEHKRKMPIAYGE